MEGQDNFEQKEDQQIENEANEETKKGMNQQELKQEPQQIQKEEKNDSLQKEEEKQIDPLPEEAIPQLQQEEQKIEPPPQAPIISNEQKSNEQYNQEWIKQSSQILDKALIDRKRTSFNLLKAWDDKRTLTLMTHKSYIDAILNSIEEKIQFSAANFQVLVKFFSDKITNETEYYTFLFEKQSKLIPQSKQKDQNTQNQIYPNLQKIFKEVDELNTQKANQLKEYTIFIQKDILINLLTKEISDYNKKVQTIKSNLNETKKSLQKNGLIASDFSQRYSKLYYDMMTSSAQSKKINKDLYIQELKFVQAAQDQINLHRQLGKEVVQAWKDVFKLEQNRMTIIHKALTSFLIKHEQIFTQNFSIEFPKKLLENYKPTEETQNYFSIKQTLSQEKIMNLKSYYSKEVQFNSIFNLSIRKSPLTIFQTIYKTFSLTNEEIHLQYQKLSNPNGMQEELRKTSNPLNCFLLWINFFS